MRNVQQSALRRGIRFRGALSVPKRKKCFNTNREFNVEEGYALADLRTNCSVRIVGMSPITKSRGRLFALIARDAPLAVVFRRGPSKRVLLVHWDLKTDKFIEGQWFNGRIYERRCDLSPSGKRLIYFAANQKKPYYSWTAVSRPPFLTALALWPKGDAWGGGGLFTSENEILLNHRPNELELADGFKLARNVRIKTLGTHSGWGEDNPIWDKVLIRDGWHQSQDGKANRHGLRSPISWTIDPPLVWAKRNRKGKGEYELQMQIKGMHVRNGPWYSIDYLVVDRVNNLLFKLEATDWADWCHSGDLLFAKDGKLFRLDCGHIGTSDELESARLLIDLSDRQFKQVTAPIEAKQWNGKFRL